MKQLSGKRSSAGSVSTISPAAASAWQYSACWARARTTSIAACVELIAAAKLFAGWADQGVGEGHVALLGIANQQISKWRISE